MTRKSISLRGVTYEALRRYADVHGESMSNVVEELLAPVLGLDYKPNPVTPPASDPDEAETKRHIRERADARRMPEPTEPGKERQGGVRLW